MAGDQAMERTDSAFRPEDCNEGELAFVEKTAVLDLNLWEGDRVFLKKMIEGNKRICLRLCYTGNTLSDIKEL